MSTYDPLPTYPDKDPTQPGQESATVEQPSSIATAVLFMRIGAGVALVQLIVTLATFSSMKDDAMRELLKTYPELTSSQLDTAYTVSVVVALVIGLISVGLWLWMASANGKGRKWARVVSTALGVLSILLIVINLTSASGDAITTIFAVLNLIVGVGALFYLYRPDSSRFYEASSRRAH